MKKDMANLVVLPTSKRVQAHQGSKFYIYETHVRLLLQVWHRVPMNLSKCNTITRDARWSVTIPSNDDVHRRKFEKWPTSQTPNIQSLLRFL
jgi:hypothetical protein